MLRDGRPGWYAWCSTKRRRRGCLMSVIEEIRSRERGGLVELPKVPRLRPGDQVQILHGPFAGQLALFRPFLLINGRAVSSSPDNHIHVAICTTLVSARRPSCRSELC